VHVSRYIIKRAKSPFLFCVPQNIFCAAYAVHAVYARRCRSPPFAFCLLPFSALSASLR
jgi:hypothetical protein